MEVQLQLQVLSNNVECADKNVKILLQQFLTMQEFLKQQFGTQFTEFCMSKNIGMRPGSTTIVDPLTNFQGPLPSSSTTDPLKLITKKDNQRISGPVIDKQPSYVEYEDSQNEILEDEGDDDSNSFIFGGVGESGDQEEDGPWKPETKYDHLQQEDDDDDEEEEEEYFGPRERQSLQKKKLVQNFLEHYMEIEEGEGKASKLKCKACGLQIANRPRNLQVHLKKCSGAEGKRFVRTIVRDNVRDFFKRVKQANTGFVKSKCNTCSEYCSDKPERLRIHLEKCNPNSFASLVEEPPRKISKESSK